LGQYKQRLGFLAAIAVKPIAIFSSDKIPKRTVRLVIEATTEHRYILAVFVDGYAATKFFILLFFVGELFSGYSNRDQWFWTYRSTDVSEFDGPFKRVRSRRDQRFDRQPNARNASEIR
jgi:hypothetical protein